MKIILIISFSILNSISAVFAQTKRFSNEEMQKCKLNSIFILNDSMNHKESNMPLEILDFDVFFYSIKYKVGTNEFMIKGKVCSMPDDKSIGLSDELIFVANEDEKGFFIDRKIFHASSTIYKEGLFRIKFELKDGQHLFFYSPAFSLVEYDLQCLVDKQ